MPRALVLSRVCVRAHFKKKKKVGEIFIQGSRVVSRGSIKGGSGGGGRSSILHPRTPAPPWKVSYTPQAVESEMNLAPRPMLFALRMY